MTASRWPRRLLAFVAATALAVAWGSIFQTQSNLAELQALGAQVPPALRALTTAQDLLGFGPLYAAVVAVAFALAFVTAAWPARHWPRARGALYAIAGGIALLVAIRAVDAATPPPVLIAATRSLAGLLAMAAGGVLGGVLFAALSRPRAASAAR